MVIYTLPPARVRSTQFLGALGNSVTEAQTILRDGWAYIAFAGTVPSSGLLRVPHNSVIIKVKDGGGTDRDFLVFGDSTDEISFGLRNTANRYWLSMQTGGFAFFFNSSNFLSFDNIRVSLKRDELRWANDLTGAMALVQNATSGAGQPLKVRAGGTSAAAAAGGALRLQAGRPGSGGAAGEVSIEGNRDDSTFDVAFRASTSGSAPTLAFYNTAPIAKPTVTGAKGGNAALTSLITALANLGLITDSTS
jgi:hypothetical protein